MARPDGMTAHHDPIDWSGRHVVVAGLGVSGIAAARALASLGAEVVGVDEREADWSALEADGVRVQRGSELPPGADLVVTSPGWRPDAPLLVTAAEIGLEVWGEVELAWRLRKPGAAQWLVVTGTNGKTTTTGLLDAMLRAAGLRSIAAGNIGTPLVEVVGSDAHDVVAVELSSFQLHWSSTVRPMAAAVLNLAPDHLDWHGDLDAYGQAKAKVWTPSTIAVANADDEAAFSLLDGV